MSLSIQELTDNLVTYANTTDDPLATIQNLTYQTALKQLSLDVSLLTKAVYQKSLRLAFLQLIQEKLQAIVDTDSWAEVVTSTFSEATFNVNATKRQIIIGVNV